MRQSVVWSVIGVVFALGCGDDPSSASAGAGGASSGTGSGTGTAGTGTIGNGCGQSSAHSEGSEGSPVVVPLSGLPYVGGLRYSDGPSYYRVTGLNVGARYELVLNGPLLAKVSVFQSGFVGTHACELPSIDTSHCFVVPQSDSVDVLVLPVSVPNDGECFEIDVALDSPAGAFEGATDNLLTLRYGTPDLPHRGIVDHERSYYRISQLKAGTRYTVYMTGRDQQVSLLVGEDEPAGGVVNSPCLAGDTKGTGTSDLSCMFKAADDAIGAAVWHYDGITSSKYVLSAFEELESEGAVGSPLVLPYGGGLVHEGHVGPRVSDSQLSASYYQVTGLTPGQDYLVGLTDAKFLQVSAYGDASFATPLPCDNSQPTQGCELSAPGTSVFVKVRSFDVHSRRFRLNVHERPTNQGSFSAPFAISYPAAFPYSGQASWTSEYLITGLPQGPLTATLTSSDGPVSFDAWAADQTTIGCSGGPGFPRCTLEASAAGQMRLRANGPGHFKLAIEPSPILSSDYVRSTSAIAIPNGTTTGLSDGLEVSGSSVTAITAVSLELFVRHGIPAELEAFLVSPNGTVVKVVAKDGGPYEGVLFDDYALESLSGLIRDAGFARRPAEPLHAFEGMNANGTWVLRVVDDENPNIQNNDGELLGWGLSFR